MLETLERLILDPITEAPPYQVAVNHPLEITGNRTASPEGHGIFLVEHSYPRPDSQSTFSSSRDSQGEERFGKPKLANRKIPIKAYVSEASGVGESTNVIPNPSFEVGLTGWISGTATGDFGLTSGLSRVTSWAVAGEYSAYLKLTKAATVTASTWKVTTPEGKEGFPVVVGTTYSLRAAINILDAPGTGIRAEIRWFKADGTVLSTTEGANVTALGEGRVIASGKAPAEAAFASCRIIAASSTSGDVVEFEIDAVQFEAQTAPTPYFDGDTPGCTWTGSPHASSAKRFGTGSNRKRFIRSFYDLQEKIEKLAEEGGTFKRVLPDGSYMVFDVVEASFVGNWEKRFNQGQEEFQFELICKPGARLAPITLAPHEEKTLPVLKFVETEIVGNMPALGDLLIEDLQGVDHNFVAISLASRFLDQSANADVFYEAEGRLRMTSATLAAGSGVASGSEANKVVSCPLFEEFTPYLSTRSSAGSYTSHVGAQKVFARVWLPETNTGSVSLRFEYAQGDLMRWRPLDPITFNVDSSDGKWILLDLGVVRLGRAAVGTQRWEGRISAKSTIPADVLQIDWIAILPVEEFYAECRNLSISPVQGAQVARDPFSQTAGVLTGKAALVGGTWSGAGDADDFNVSGSGSVSRIPAAVDVSSTANDPTGTFSGGKTGRYERLGAGVVAGGSVECDVDAPSSTNGTITERRGVMARYTDTNNLVLGFLDHDHRSNGEYLYLVNAYYKKEGGAWKLLRGAVAPPLTPGAIYRLILTINTDGSGSIALMSGSTTVALNTWKATADLATGGKLASGGYGIYHEVSGSLPSNYSNTFDNFTVREFTSPTTDAVVYANRDLRIRWDKAVREASDGSGAFSDVGLYGGDRLLVPHSGREGRPVRFAILTSRGQPETEEDTQADDMKATLTIIPRVTEVPEAA